MRAWVTHLQGPPYCQCPTQNISATKLNPPSSQDQVTSSTPSIYLGKLFNLSLQHRRTGNWCAILGREGDQLEPKPHFLGELAIKHRHTPLGINWVVDGAEECPIWWQPWMPGRSAKLPNKSLPPPKLSEVQKTKSEVFVKKLVIRTYVNCLNIHTWWNPTNVQRLALLWSKFLVQPKSLFSLFSNSCVMESTPFKFVL